MRRLGLRRAAASTGAAAVLAVPVIAATTDGDSQAEPLEATTTTTTTTEEPDYRTLYVAEKKRSRKRLIGWRKAERKTVGLRRAMRARVRLGGARGVLAGLLCIHGHEGSWTDAGAPFWGGLQMDRQFQMNYGGSFYRALGTADRWPAVLQLAVGANAFYSGRGFEPWPTTRRLCGI